MSLRRTVLPLLVLLASSATAAAVGCGGLGVATSADSFGGSNDVPGAGGGDVDAASAPFATAPDAGTVPPPASPLKSNPLCGWTTSTCDPQNDNRELADGGTTTDTCRSLLGDAGGAGGYSDAGFACHVAKSPKGQGVTPVCTPEGTTTGTCIASAQCTAGHECVGAGSNVEAECRRYCCVADACEPTTFCDVQPIVASSGLMVPVCMPSVSCDLLASQTAVQCPPEQQCGVALDGKGLEIKTCLDVGPRGIGDDCETDHCGKDLACLGAPGARKCFQLCDTAKGAGKYPCPMGQTCRASGTTFSGNVGICGN